MAFALDNRTAVYLGYYQITVLAAFARRIDTLIGVDIPADANVCLIQVDEVNTLTDDNQAVRYCEGYATPTQSVGFVMGKGDYREFTNINQIKSAVLISAEAGVDVLVNVQFYKQ